LRDPRLSWPFQPGTTHRRSPRICFLPWSPAETFNQKSGTEGTSQERRPHWRPATLLKYFQSMKALGLVVTTRKSMEGTLDVLKSRNDISMFLPGCRNRQFNARRTRRERTSCKAFHKLKLWPDESAWRSKKGLYQYQWYGSSEFSPLP